MIQKAQKEKETVAAVRKDVGYDIISDSILKSRHPAEFCMSLRGKGMLEYADFKQMKSKKQLANKD